MPKKCLFSTNSVTNFAKLSMFLLHDNETYDERFRTELIYLFLFASCYRIMSSLTSVLYLDKRASFEMSTKISLISSEKNKYSQNV